MQDLPIKTFKYIVGSQRVERLTLVGPWQYAQDTHHALLESGFRTVRCGPYAEDGKEDLSRFLIVVERDNHA